VGAAELIVAKLGRGLGSATEFGTPGEDITMVGKLPIACAVILDELQTPQGNALPKLID
jgi:hypothetical protein